MVLLLQYNIQSLTRNKHYLDHYINRFQTDFCLLSEIFNFSDDKENTSFPNYNILTKKRQNNSFGGVAILVRKSIKFKQIHFNSTLEVLICQSLNLSKNLTIASIYIPQSVPTKIFELELTKLLNFLDTKSNVFLCGDFNARSRTFGDSINSPRGNVLGSLIDNSGFHHLNNGKITFKASFMDPTCHGSVLDLTFTNTTLNVNWNIQQTLIGGSHHLPIHINIDEIQPCCINFLQNV